MTLHAHAERELKLAGLYDESSDYGGMLPEAVLELVDVFAKQGHSGGSAARVIGLFKTLASYKILAPLTGKPEEWSSDVAFRSPNQKPYQQNLRDSRVFRDSENNETATFDEAIIWRGREPHDTFTGRLNGIPSGLGIKAFPFTPKTFYVDVEKHYDIENYPDLTVVEGAGKYVYTLVDPKQLDEVYEYYKRPSK